MTNVDATKVAIHAYVDSCRTRGINPGIPPVVFLRSAHHTLAEAIELLDWLEATYPAIYRQVRASFPNF